MNRIKKVLVTGGSGFIGSGLVSRLKDLGYKVDRFDLTSGQNIKNNNQLREFIKKEYDIIYHLAALSGPAISNIHRTEFFRVNTLSTIKICEFILKYSPKTRLILSGSRLEYGKPIYLPVDEKHQTFPSSIYGLTKLAATQISLGYHMVNGLDVVVIRTSNTYGPSRRKNFPNYNIINYFVSQAKKNQVLPVFGDGKQKRDYIYIDDLIEAFILIGNGGRSGQIYNLGYGKGIEFKQMVNLIVKKMKLGKIEYIGWPKEYKKVETGDYISDISKIKKELGFKPKVDFEEGIERVVEKING